MECGINCGSTEHPTRVVQAARKVPLEHSTTYIIDAIHTYKKHATEMEVIGHPRPNYSMFLREMNCGRSIVVCQNRNKMYYGLLSFSHRVVERPLHRFAAGGADGLSYFFYILRSLHHSGHAFNSTYLILWKLKRLYFTMK